MKNRENEPPLSADLQSLLAKTRVLSPAELAKLAAAAESLDEDPAFRAELLKSLFVEHLQEAMEEQQVSQSELARRWGKSRQYLSKVLNEDRRINFTIETMAELASLVGRRLEIKLGPASTTEVSSSRTRSDRIVPNRQRAAQSRRPAGQKSSSGTARKVRTTRKKRTKPSSTNLT